MKKIYRGERIHGTCWVTVEEGGVVSILSLIPSLAVRNHSPTGFEWGYNGSGPAQLALAILMDHFMDQTNSSLAIARAQSSYQDFKDEVVARWGSDVWQIASAEIDAWAAVARPSRGRRKP